MRDILDALLARWRAGQPVGLAVVTAAWASAPRPPGTAMFVDTDGTAVGSVSGGCVEADVYQRCREVLGGGAGHTVRYGVSDEAALAVGLPCGGSIELFVSRLDPVSFPSLPRLVELLAAGTPAALVTIVDGPPERLGQRLIVPGTGPVGVPPTGAATAGAAPAGTAQADAGQADAAQTDVMPPEVLADVQAMLADDRTGLLPTGKLSMLVNAFVPAARMLVFGSTDHAAATARIGTFLGYRVTVCDARRVFTTAARFPDAADVVVDWPHRYLLAEAVAGRIDSRTVVCVLTHDPKFDVAVLRVALGLPLAYVGAMGSRRTHDDRLDRLRQSGVDDATLGRLASPIGLDLGAHTPQETAVSIAAEITALRRGGTGARLRDNIGPIHPTGLIDRAVH